jgi:hypothetical protein
VPSLLRLNHLGLAHLPWVGGRCVVCLILYRQALVGLWFAPSVWGNGVHCLQMGVCQQRPIHAGNKAMASRPTGWIPAMCAHIRSAAAAAEAAAPGCSCCSAASPGRLVGVSAAAPLPVYLARVCCLWRLAAYQVTACAATSCWLTGLHLCAALLCNTAVSQEQQARCAAGCHTLSYTLLLCKGLCSWWRPSPKQLPASHGWSSCVQVAAVTAAAGAVPASASGQRSPPGCHVKGWGAHQCCLFDTRSTSIRGGCAPGGHGVPWLQVCDLVGRWRPSRQLPAACNLRVPGVSCACCRQPP